MKRHQQPPVQADDHAGGHGDILGPNSQIGQKLREYYDGLLSDEVPERFSELLGQLEKAEKAARDDESEMPDIDKFS